MVRGRDAMRRVCGAAGGDETRARRDARDDETDESATRRDATSRADEIDRLDRKVVTQEDMYGRANPKPTPPSFDAEDVRKMRAAEEARLLAARADDGDVAWLDIDVPRELGLELDRYKWRQNQSFVEVFVRLPRGCARKDVRVEISATTLDVVVRDERVVGGALRAAVKAELSTWVIVDDVLEISLLKKNRRGHYDDGCTNADTYWRTLLAESSADAPTLPLCAPSAYYGTEYEIERDLGNNARHSSNAPMISTKSRA